MVIIKARNRFPGDMRLKVNSLLDYSCSFQLNEIDEKFFTNLFNTTIPAIYGRVPFDRSFWYVVIGVLFLIDK